MHIGNFVEVKEALIEAGAKANHLTYIGDARVGAGQHRRRHHHLQLRRRGKHRTDIGERAFIGSNSALVAPRQDRRRRLCRSGSVITGLMCRPIALAIGRGRQMIKEGWAERRAAKLRAKRRPLSRTSPNIGGG